MQILISGISGLIGSALASALRARGDMVRGTSRTAQGDQLIQLPQDVDGWAEAVDGLDAVINLAGAPVAARWSGSHKDTMRQSRIALTEQLVAGIARATRKPSLLISGSAVGYYGCSATDDREFTEADGPGDDFLAELCRDWEAAAQAAEPGLRVVTLRTGVVLDRHGGALAKMLFPFRMGLGGPAAGGQQWMSWIHLDDLVRMLIWALDQPDLSGPLNGVAPTPLTNREFSKSLASVLHRPCLFPLPGFVLRLMFGDGAVIVTQGQRVVPRRAVEGGFSFDHPELRGALETILTRR